MKKTVLTLWMAAGLVTAYAGKDKDGKPEVMGEEKTPGPEIIAPAAVTPETTPVMSPETLSAPTNPAPLMDYGLAAEVLKLDPAQAAAALDQNLQASQTYQNALLMQYLAQESLRRGLTARYDVNRALHDAQQRVLVMALRADVVRSVPAITEAEAKEYYEKNIQRWEHPDQFQVDAVRLTNSTPSLVSSMTTLLSAVSNWVEKVESISTNAVPMASRASGNWFGSNVVEQVIWTALNEMKAGSVRDVKVGDQTIVIRRGEFRKAGTIPFDIARNEAMNMLRGEREEKVWQDFLAGVREKQRISPE